MFAAVRDEEDIKEQEGISENEPNTPSSSSSGSDGCSCKSDDVQGELSKEE